jgi:DNA uptake protein ComE-like DNA-binding protein
MENNKTLFVASQYKRKGFLYFLCATFLLHLSYFVYIEHSAPRIDLVIEKLPEELVTIKKPIASELAPSSLKQLEKGTKALKIKTVRSVLDVNKATALDFQKVYGIGPVYSKRIVKFRAIFGGFVLMDQLQQVYGLDTIVVKALKASFSVQGTPVIRKISVNNASVYELQILPFFTKELAEKIVSERAKNGLFNDFEKISNILGLPEDKIEIIKLYLNF